MWELDESTLIKLQDYSGAGFCYDLNLGVGYRLNSDWSLNLRLPRYLVTGVAGDDYDRIKSHMLILSRITTFKSTTFPSALGQGFQRLHTYTIAIEHCGFRSNF